jgi:cytochrome c
MLKWVLAAGLIAAGSAAASAQDADAGKSVFNKCRACHSTDAGKNMVGPSLHGVYGRKAGSVEGFNYSDAMKASGKTWDDAALDAYIADPKGAVPGNKMVFVGIKDETDRKNLIAFLKTVK